LLDNIDPGQAGCMGVGKLGATVMEAENVLPYRLSCHKLLS